MKFVSTRNNRQEWNLENCLEMGLAPDGGLFIPQSIPKVNIKEFKKDDFSEFSARLLSPFFKNSILESKLKCICEESFNFPLKTKELDKILVMELFHGPTLAFKDFGARFLANCLNSLDKELNVLVATSGDTGGAVASAFYKKKNIKVGILFPKNGVSKEQFEQLTHWDHNIYVFAVDGTFDDCQKIVKDSFKLNKINHLTSANSINIGRLLAQMTYYAYFSLKGNDTFIIPSGNIGNSIGAYWAKEMGFPIKKIILATNSNKAVSHFAKTKEMKSFPTIKTIANAMDVGFPSNLERLSSLNLEGVLFNQVSDKELLKTIDECYVKYNYLMDPHTAIAMKTALDLNEKCIIVSTAHPLKFKSVLIENFPYLLKELNQDISFEVKDSRFFEIKTDLNKFNQLFNLLTFKVSN